MFPSIFLLSALSLSVFSMTSGQEYIDGPCPDMPGKKNFQPEKFSGFWYEIEDYREGILGIAFKLQKCNTAIIGVVDPKTIQINTSYVGRFLGVSVKHYEVGKIANPSHPAQWTICKRPEVVVKFRSKHNKQCVHYSILLTNYKKYALAWACSGDEDYHEVRAWILSRSDVMPNRRLNRIYKKLGRYGLKQDYFRPTNQRNCTYT